MTGGAPEGARSDGPDISVVIPAYNEKDYIAATVRCALEHIPARYAREVIVVDHGSQDDTVRIAREAGADVLEYPDAPTISALRNAGVARSRGRILVFLDADTTLTPAWTEAAPAVLDGLDTEPMQLTGARRRVPEGMNVLAKYWFAPKADEVAPTHIGGGHIVTTRRLFDAVGGFPAGMETGEDYRFCLDAKAAGARLHAVPALGAVHNGLPRTLRQFFDREAWHGRGDWTNLHTVLTTKVALATLIFLGLHLLLVAGLVGVFAWPAAAPWPAWAAGAAVLGIVGLCLASSFLKFHGRGPVHVLFNTAVYFIYYVARSVAFFSALTRRRIIKHERA
ncbi:glycosyltransferase [bacterium]|nr:glycosyltransferase [bacterium]